MIPIYEVFIGKLLHPNDPVYSCDFYLENGCTHIDGMDCNMPSCKILENHKMGNIQDDVDL